MSTTPTFLELTNTLETYLSDNWSYTPIAYENEQFEPTGDDPFIALNIVLNPSENAAIGKVCVRLNGTISIRVYARYDIGSKTSLDLVDKLVEILENKTIGTILTYAANVSKIGEASRAMNRIESGWYMVLTQFRFDTA